jgi:ribonuclease HII
MKKYYSNKLEVGIDEVARGCLAGPVFTAAVIWPKDLDCEYQNEIKDSKKLSKKKRKFLREYIEYNAIDFSVAFKDNTVIDKYNILTATHMAMHDSIKKLNIIPELLLVDGNTFTPYYHNNDVIEHTCIIEGDNKYLPIACASILAKVYHDEYVEMLINNNKDLNKYDWGNNMCYGTKNHINAIKEYGISKYHRKTFGICKDYIIYE